MKIFDNPSVDTGFKILGAVVIFFGLKKVFSQADGKRGFSVTDLQKATTYILFVWAFVYMIVAERGRDHEWHIFDDLWMAFVITGLFSALALDKILENMSRLIELIIQLRTKAVVTSKSSETTTVAAVVTTKDKID
jgi:hypothetical protein